MGPNVPLGQFPFVLYADCALAGACEPPIGFCDESQNPNNVADVTIDAVRVAHRILRGLLRATGRRR